MDFTLLLPLIQEHGVWPVVAGVILWALYKRFGLRKPAPPGPSPEEIRRVQQRLTGSETPFEGLARQHPFFRPYFRTIVDRSIRFESLGRTSYFQDLFEVLVRHYQDHFLDVLRQEITPKDKVDWRNHIRSTFHNARSAWIEDWYRFQTPVPQSVMEKVLEQHEAAENHFLAALDDTAFRVAPDYLTAVNVSLMFLSTLILEMIRDLVKANINGDLDGLTYKGMSLGPHSDDDLA